MAKGGYSHCGREADDLLKCTGVCGGGDLYCNRTCQKAEWVMHKNICPCGDDAPQPFTFIMPPLANGFPFPEAPVHAVHKMDVYGNSGVMLLLYSVHLGIERLIQHAKFYCYDDNDKNEVHDVVKAMIEGDPPFLCVVTSPVPPEVMKLKPSEACFNTEKYPEAVWALLEKGIITDTGKKVKLDYYEEKFPVCRVNAPQTDDFKNF